MGKMVFCEHFEVLGYEVLGGSGIRHVPSLHR
jgi:hypothetical protein